MHHTMPCQTAIRCSSGTPAPVTSRFLAWAQGLECSSGMHACMHLPRPGCWPGHRAQCAAQARMHLPRPGCWPGHRAQVHAAEAKKHLLQVLLYAFVCSCLGQLPGMVSSSGHVPEAAGGLRDMSGGRAYQSALECSFEGETGDFSRDQYAAGKA